MNLAELEALFWRGARGEAEDAELDAAFCARGERAGAQRMAMYRNGYFTRLRAALADTFPATCRALGEARFAALARRQALERPSRYPDIERAGEGFDTLLESTPDVARVAPLARLEWARLGALLAPAHGALDVPSLQGVNVEHVHFVWAPSLRICAADARSLDLLAGRETERPDGVVHVAFWRRGTHVQHRTLEPLEVDVLVPMTGELAFVALCERLARLSPDPTAAAARLVGRAFRDGWICDLKQESRP